MSSGGGELGAALDGAEEGGVLGTGGLADAGAEPCGVARGAASDETTPGAAGSESPGLGCGGGDATGGVAGAETTETADALPGGVDGPARLPDPRSTPTVPAVNAPAAITQGHRRPRRVTGTAAVRGWEVFASGRPWLEITADATLAPLEGVDSGDNGRWPRRGRVGAVGAGGGMLRLFG